MILFAKQAFGLGFEVAKLFDLILMLILLIVLLAKIEITRLHVIVSFNGHVFSSLSIRDHIATINMPDLVSTMIMLETSVFQKRHKLSVHKCFPLCLIIFLG